MQRHEFDPSSWVATHARALVLRQEKLRDVAALDRLQRPPEADTEAFKAYDARRRRLFLLLGWYQGRAARLAAVTGVAYVGAGHVPGVRGLWVVNLMGLGELFAVKDES